MAEPVQILVAHYATPVEAEVALRKLEASKQDQGVAVNDAVILRRDTSGKIHIHETEDISGGQGAAVGGLLGGIIGLIAGPAGVVAGAAVGAAVGGATAGLFDTGIRHKRLEQIGASLEPDRGALVILTEPGFVPFIESVIGGDDVQILGESMSAEDAEQLAHDHEVAVKSLKMGDALAEGGVVETSPSPEERKAE
jgi:uncharacterized membrane protein